MIGRDLVGLVGGHAIFSISIAAPRRVHAMMIVLRAAVYVGPAIWANSANLATALTRPRS